MLLFLHFAQLLGMSKDFYPPQFPSTQVGKKWSGMLILQQFLKEHKLVPSDYYNGVNHYSASIDANVNLSAMVGFLLTAGKQNVWRYTGTL